MSGKADRDDMLRLADLYVPFMRCPGGRLIHQNYVGHICGSDDPDSYCLSPRRGWRDEADRKAARSFARHGEEQVPEALRKRIPVYKRILGSSE